MIHINDACSEFTDCRVYVHAFVKLCSPFENGACNFDCTQTTFTSNWRDTIKQELGSNTLGKVRSKRDADKKVYSGNVLSLGPLFVQRKRDQTRNVGNDEKVYSAFKIFCPAPRFDFLAQNYSENSKNDQIVVVGTKI